MRKILLILFTVLSTLTLDAQTLDIGPPDTSICDGVAIDIIAVTNTGSPVNPIPVSYTLTDDSHTGIVDMGFDFEYYGNIYNQCVISSNSYITFDLTGAGGGSQWAINAAAPSPGFTTNNKIMFPWQDTNPFVGGTITSVICGVEPFRKFIVTYDAVAMFSCTTLEFTNQLVLHETTNIIEMHIESKPLCLAWNGGVAIQGLENIDGTVGHIVPGRNFPTQWSVTFDGYEFVPDGLGGYTMTVIPFDPINITNANQLNWYVDALNTVPISTNVPQINVSPVVDTWYFCEYITCGELFVDSILVQIGTTTVTPSVIDVTCFGFTDGMIELDATGTIPDTPIYYEVMDANLVTIQNIATMYVIDTVFGLGVGDYHIIATNDIGCVDVIDVVINEPDVLVANGDHSDISCWGENDGVAYVYPFGGTQPRTVQWNDPLNQTTESINGLVPGNVQVTITDANGCILDTNMNIIEPLPVNFNVTSWEDTCYRHNGQILIEMSGGIPPYDYIWFSDINPNNSTVDDIDNFNLVTGLPHGTYNISVYDANGCSVDITSDVTLIYPPVASFHQQFPTVATEIINADILFDNSSTNAESYEWLFGDGYNTTLTNPTHTYGNAGTYLVQLIAYSDPNLGCTDTAYGYTTIDPLYTFYVPNSFTPDGDGLNDVWGPDGQFYESESYNLKVFDRWGKIMFNTDNPNQFWNGRYLNTGSPVKQGAYVYIFELKKFNTFEPKTITGLVYVYKNI